LVSAISPPRPHELDPAAVSRRELVRALTHLEHTGRVSPLERGPEKLVIDDRGFLSIEGFDLGSLTPGLAGPIELSPPVEDEATTVLDFRTSKGITFGGERLVQQHEGSLAQPGELRCVACQGESAGAGFLVGRELRGSLAGRGRGPVAATP
jgi:hypothetical protein